MKRSFSFEGGRRAWNRSKWVRTTAILILWLAVSLGNAADVSRELAADTVMKILIPATLQGDATVYLSAAPLKPGDIVRPFESKDGSTTIQTATWFAYIDDEPFTFFTHPTRFVYIEAATGKITVEVQGWWPLVNNVAPFTQTAVEANPSLLIFSTRNFKRKEVVAP
jgi:hypothetical protein